MKKLLNLLKKIVGFIPLPVVILAVLVAILTVAPLAFLSLNLEKKLDKLNTEVYLIKSTQELLLPKKESTKSATPSPKTTPSPVAKRVVVPEASFSATGK
jgi:hypothetical protein